MDVQSQSGSSSEVLESVVVRFAGDSGDGIQVAGARLTNDSAQAGNDLATAADFPAEIRAPAGSIPGVSGFQINFGSNRIFTAGDQPDVLVAMNPAALKKNISDLKSGGILICNTDGFSEKNLSKAGYDQNPLESEELSEKYRFVAVPITKLTTEALKDSPLTNRAVQKCKNFFALGVVSWLFERSVEGTLHWLEDKFGTKPELVEANKTALLAGIAFADNSELFQHSYTVQPAALPSGTYRNITGNTGLAYGLISGARSAGLPLFYGSYPITPASDILHELSKHKEFDVLTFQAEDEIAAACAAIGASYGGNLGVTASSGPGILLKQEAINLR